MSRRVFRPHPPFLPVCLILMMIALVSRSAVAQPGTSTPVDTAWRSGRAGTPPQDSVGVDSTGRDTTGMIGRPGDTARLFSYAGTLGSTAGDREDAGYRFVTMAGLVSRRYYTPFDIVAPLLPAYPLTQGSAGQMRMFSYAGATPGAVAVLYNGRALPGDREAGYDLELYPPEFFNRIEILRGARAMLHGSGESLIALNFVQPRYDVEGSYVRLGYSQGPYNTTSADITYARNVGSRSNLTLGLHRVSSDGEFDNSDVSNTSLRGVYTINPVEGLALSITEIYYNAVRGLNGGLTAESPRNPNNESVNEPNLDEEQIRHDLTLAARWAPGDPADSMSGTSRPAPLSLDGALYFTSARRDLVGRAESIRSGEWRREIAGLRASASLPADVVRVDINLLGEFAFGGFADTVDGDAAARAEAGAVGELALGPMLLRAGAKAMAGEGDSIGTVFVGEGILGLAGELSARGTIRMFNGGSVIADAAGRGFDSRPTRLLGEGAIEWKGGGTEIGLDGFFRQARESGGSSYGAGAHLRLPLPLQLVLDARLLGQIDPDGADRFPALHGTGDLWGEWKIFRGNLDLRVGTTLVYQSGLRGAEYDQIANEPLLPDPAARDLSVQLPIWGFYAQGRIGSAFLRATVDNILDVEQWTIYRYPIVGRGIHLQATWVLID